MGFFLLYKIAWNPRGLFYGSQFIDNFKSDSIERTDDFVWILLDFLNQFDILMIISVI